MAGLEVLTGNKKLSILQCQELAKDVGFDSSEFNLCGPKGKIRCKWLDAYLGMFQKADGSDGNKMMMVPQFQFLPDVWCENILPASKE